MRDGKYDCPWCRQKGEKQTFECAERDLYAAHLLEAHGKYLATPGQPYPNTRDPATESHIVLLVRTDRLLRALYLEYCIDMPRHLAQELAAVRTAITDLQQAQKGGGQ